jgi:hypothetical protein
MNAAMLIRQLEIDRQGCAATISRCEQRLARVEKQIERDPSAPARNLNRSLVLALQRERRNAYARLRDADARIATLQRCAEQNNGFARLDLIGF